MLLVKVPVPEPSVVKLLLLVGLADVFQHTPRDVTVAPPSEVTFPPEEAVVVATSEIAVVVTAAST
jgi:hypothetical protein